MSFIFCVVGLFVGWSWFCSLLDWFVAARPVVPVAVVVPVHPFDDLQVPRGWGSRPSSVSYQAYLASADCAVFLDRAGR